MFRKKKSFRNSGRTSARRSKLYSQGRSLRFETMEGRLVLSATGFAGNECAPELDDAALDAIVPMQSASPQTAIAFQFRAADVVKDEGAGATPVDDIRFILDPDVDPRFRTNGSTPIGANLAKNDQGTTDVSDDTYDFSWTPTRQQIGTYRLFIIATDDGGTGNVPLSDVYSFELTINNKPSVDLNGDNDGGINFGPVDFTEGDVEPVKIVDTDLSIPFVRDDMVLSATVEIVNPQIDGLETLGIDGGALDVDATTPGKLVITVVGGGLASKAEFETALKSLTYINTSDDPVAMQTIHVTINDGVAESDAAVATVKISGTNDSPDLLQSGTLGNSKVGEEYLIELVAEDPDGGDLLVFQIQGVRPNEFTPDSAVITPNPTGSGGKNTIQVARDPNDGKFHAQIEWTPTEADLVAQRALGDGGSVLFRITVTDTSGAADSEDYFVTIENQAPVANNDPEAGSDSLDVGEDAGDTVLAGDILANDTDADGDTFTVHSVSAGGSTFTVGVEFTHPTSGAVILVAADGQVTYNPNKQFESLGAGTTATDTFQYTIIDENGSESAQADVTVTINGANDAPAQTNGVAEFRISEAAGATILDLATLLVAAADVDAGDTLSVVAAPGNPTEGGIFALNNEELSFDPNGDFNVDNGAEQPIDFMVTIQDAAGETLEIAAKIIIEGVNDAPVAVNDLDYSTDEDTTLSITTRATGVLGNDTDDADTASLMVSQIDGDAANVGAAVTLADSSGREGVLTVNADGTFTFDPSGDFNTLAAGTSSEVTFTYVATDGAAENAFSNTATVTIEIMGVNDAPVANDVAGAVFEDGQEIDVAFDGSDVDDGETANLTYGLVVPPLDGFFVNNNDGTFRFIPGLDFQELAEGAVQNVTFKYTATDAQAAVSDEAFVTIAVTGVNDAPLFDLDNTDGLASTLPTGDFQSPNVINIELDISSADANIRSLNLIDIPMFVSDIDGDSIGISLAEGDNEGTPFRNIRPSLNSSSQLEWTPAAADVGTGYVIRVQAQDQPSMGGALSDSFDLVVSVVGLPSVKSVSPSINVLLNESVVTIMFDEMMGNSAFDDTTKYTFVAANGTAVNTSASVSSATSIAGNTGVELRLNKPTINDIFFGGGTKLELTLDPEITNASGDALGGLLVFEILLINNQ